MLFKSRRLTDAVRWNVVSRLRRPVPGKVGEPPLQYLTRWRKHETAGMLRSGSESLGEIAGRIAYEAQAASSKAFKRWAGHAPGANRQSSRIAAAYPTG